MEAWYESAMPTDTQCLVAVEPLSLHIVRTVEASKGMTALFNLKLFSKEHTDNNTNPMLIEGETV